MKERDYAYEALAETTGSDMDANRGELNAALKSIRSQSDITDSYLLSDEIHKQARRYRFVMGDEVLLTAPALAKHWKRVKEESLKQKGGTNLVSHKSDECQTCGGDRMVVVGVREPMQTKWMATMGIKPSPTHKLEEFAPCPDCNPDVMTTTRRFDGSYATAPDPARTRELMKQ